MTTVRRPTMVQMRKSGPLHFFSTAERSTHLAVVVEYCVQRGERQFVDRSGARFLVVSGEVMVDGDMVCDLRTFLDVGTYVVTVRDRDHVVKIHPAMYE